MAVKLSDQIEALLKAMMDANEGVVEITRGELAERVNCVPSQVTYVLSTRFRNCQGYLVESQRGGGGWIRIQRVFQGQPSSELLVQTAKSLEKGISQQEANITIQHLYEQGALPLSVAKLLMTATTEYTLARLPKRLRDELRRDLLQKLLLQQAHNGELED